MNTTSPVTIILADNPYFTKGLKAALRRCSAQSLHILAEASNGKELLQAVEQHRPHLVITGVKLPLINGIEACRHICRLFPQTAVIAMSLDQENILSLYEAGAKACLLKYASQSEILQAIQTVCRGDTYYSQYTISMIAHLYSLGKPRPRKKSPSVFFSQKEKQIIALICRQYTTKDIAQHLHLGTRTIEDYRHKIQEKMNVKNMVGIALYAVKHGIVQLSKVGDETGN